MTNGDKGEEVCNALRQRVAGLWLALRRFVGVSLLLIAITDDIEQRRLSPSAGRSQIDMASWGAITGRTAAPGLVISHAG